LSFCRTGNQLIAYKKKTIDKEREKKEEINWKDDVIGIVKDRWRR